MIDWVIMFTRAEDGGVSVVRPYHRGRLATMWIYPGKGGGLVYFDGPLPNIEPMAAPGDPVPPVKWVSDADFEIALAAGAFESDDAFLARLLRDAVPPDAQGTSVVAESKIPVSSRADRAKWRLDAKGAIVVADVAADGALGATLDDSLPPAG